VSRLIKRKVKTDCDGKQKAEENLRLRPEEYTSIDCVSDWRAFSLVYWSNCKIKLNRLFFSSYYRKRQVDMFVQRWWCTTWILVVTMPCGLIVFDCHLLVIVVILVEFVVSKSIFIDKDQREFPMSRDKLMKKDRRHSIFDDKNRAVLGELVSFIFYSIKIN
jgi:hypothetical protein